MHFCADRRSESAILYTAKPSIAPDAQALEAYGCGRYFNSKAATKLSTGKHRGVDAYSCRRDRASAKWQRSIAITTSRA
jgi:hypothetical protein